MLDIFCGWFSTWDDAGNQGGFTIFCTSEADGLKYFEETCGEDHYLNDCGFNKLEQYEVDELVQDFNEGVIDKEWFTAEAFRNLF